MQETLFYYFREKGCRMRTLALYLILTVSSISLFAQEKFEEGKHYEVIADQKTATPTVTEFFSLFCSHCFQFETLIDTVKASLKAGTKFEKSHVSYMPRGNQEAQKAIVKAFVAMNDLGMQEELSRQFFAAIHLKGVKLDSEEDIKQIFIANDISEERITKMFNDQDLIKRAIVMSREWERKKIATVPTFLVNGKYKINMSSLNNLDELVSLTNFLLEK